LLFSNIFANVLKNTNKSTNSISINGFLAAAGYNFGLLLRWLEALLRPLFTALTLTAPQPNSRESASLGFLHARLNFCRVEVACQHRVNTLSDSA
jgi:hypothetical protein